MAAPTSTTWPLDPHSSAKHAILRGYLNAWIPILAQGGFQKVIYIDGFAGPGRYDGGEDGSPIIALKVALAQASKIRGRFVFFFVEERADRAALLGKLVGELALPSNFDVQIKSSTTFAKALPELQSAQRDGRGQLPPTFAFIDPFGFSDCPFHLVKGILQQPSCEILKTFMYEEINRFISLPDQSDNFDDLFGTNDWRAGLLLRTAIERDRFIHGLYLRQLKDATGGRYARSFQMRNLSNRIDYYLFYATKNLLGLKRMKAAMWQVDQSGSFSFSDATDPSQTVLFGSEPRFEDLKRQIVNRFAGKETSVGNVEEFVVADTAFRESHYKRVLKSLELDEPCQLQVLEAPAKRKRGQYPDGKLRLKFA